MHAKRPWSAISSQRRSNQFTGLETIELSPRSSPRAPCSSPDSSWLPSPEQTPVSSPRRRRRPSAIRTHQLDKLYDRSHSPRYSSASSNLHSPPSMTLDGTERSSRDFRFSTDDDSPYHVRDQSYVRDVSSPTRGMVEFEYMGYGDAEITPCSPIYQLNSIDASFRNSDVMSLSKVLSPSEYIRACTRLRDTQHRRSHITGAAASNLRVVSAPPKAYHAPGLTSPERPVHRVRAVTAPTSPARLHVFPTVAHPPVHQQATVPRGFIPMTDFVLTPERSVFDDDDDDDYKQDRGSIRPFSRFKSQIQMSPKVRDEPWYFFQNASSFFSSLVSCGQKRRR